MTDVAVYPSYREADVALRDGSTVHVRPVRAEDRDAVLAFLRSLSRASQVFRYFSGGVDLEAEADRAVDVDYAERYALVATIGLEPRLVGHASYATVGAGRAEVALAIADDFQGRGLGTILLAQLAEVAEEREIGPFEAHVMPDNHRMVDVLRESGFPVRTRSEPGEIVFEFPTSLTPTALERFERREQIAAEAALRVFLRPRSVAVIGASRDPDTIGGKVFHNLLAVGFAGPVYPVNPSAPVVQSVVAYPSILDVPGAVDLAVVVVPAKHVVSVAHECAEKGVRALVVISAGFAEIGPEGQERQRDLLAVCRAAGMRLIGPNCMGIVNTAADVRLAATFAPIYPPAGRVGFLSQSGALGLAVIDHARARGIGLSSFVSVGNKADISGNDLLGYWETDPATDLILLYLESFGNPRTFSRITRRVGMTKPIVAVKSGRSVAGARATSSHTGALLASSDVTVDALFRQAGVIRTDTLEELFEVAALLANQPVPEGGRVAILTNGGGPGILCADACEANGLVVPALPDEVTARLRTFLPAEASFGNPVDMIASASADDYARAIDVLAAHDGIDAIVVIFIPPLVTRAEDAARAIKDAVRRLPRRVPVLSVFMSASGVPDALRGDGVRIPSYAFPEAAARALAAAARYGAWRKRPVGAVPVFPEIRRDEAAAVLASALARGPGWLAPAEVARLFAAYGLPLAEQRIVASPAEAARAADEIGAPVALKAVAPGLVHKTEAGAVRLGLAGGSAVRAAATDMSARVAAAGHRVDGFLVQRMVPSGVEMLVGVVHDPLFGPVVACGAGGTAVELLKDVAVCITPLTDRDVYEMVRSLATFPLLDGYRGAAKADVPALEEIVLRVGAMVEEHPAIAEMDANPVMVLERGASIVDARVRVEVPPRRAPFAARTTSVRQA